MSDLLEGMIIRQDTMEASPPVTTLRGELRDQAALAGVLNSLYELHLTVISVTRISKGDTSCEDEELAAQAGAQLEEV